MREPDMDPEHVHGPSRQVRWPERMADSLNSIPLMMIVMPFLGSYSVATQLHPLVEAAIGLGEMAASLILMVIFKVGQLRAGERPKRTLAIAINLLLLQPAWAGTIRLMEPINAIVLNVLDRMGITDWKVLIPLLTAEFLCFSLVSWLIIVIARRATAYILLTAPPAA
jgi:hypothetical protein